jgi:hypothetical protein
MTRSTHKYARRGKPLRWLLNSIKIETDECIVWPFYTKPNGYGQINYFGVVVDVHRLVLHLVTGYKLFSSSLDVIHSCDNRPCVNKRHLSPGTRFQNMKDASSKGRLVRESQTSCGRGHPLDETNTYIAPDGRRRCKKCRYLAVMRFRTGEATEA